MAEGEEKEAMVLQKKLLGQLSVDDFEADRSVISLPPGCTIFLTMLKTKYFVSAF